MIELKPAQQRILERVAQSGMSPEEVLDQAFAVIEEQLDHEDWMLENREAISAQIEEGLSQAERGEVFGPDQAMRILRERRANRQVA